MRIDKIKAECKRKMMRAMNDTAQDANQIITKSFDQFYAGGTPYIYDRKYILPDAKDIRGPISTGNTSILKAGYDGSKLKYPEGMTWNGHLSKFDGPAVLDAVTSGTYKVVGDSTFDEVALDKIKQTASDNFNKFFHK